MMAQTKLQRAESLALEAHGTQRYGQAPYSVHLAAVIAVLRRFGVSEDSLDGQALLCAAWLHDTLEDTNLEAARIAQIDPLTLDLVRRVTDEPGQTRAEKKALTYPKIAAAPLAVALKLADRIANVETCLKLGDARSKRKLERYREEHAGFQKALSATTGPWLEAMWEHLNGLFQSGTDE